MADAHGEVIDCLRQAFRGMPENTRALTSAALKDIDIFLARFEPPSCSSHSPFMTANGIQELAHALAFYDALGRMSEDADDNDACGVAAVRTLYRFGWRMRPLASPEAETLNDMSNAELDAWACESMRTVKRLKLEHGKRATLH